MSPLLDFLSVYADLTHTDFNELEYLVDDKPSIERLVADSFLRFNFDEFVPYINNLGMIQNRLLLINIPTCYKTYLKEYGIVERERRYKIKHSPKLFTVLFYEPSHYEALKYILENWFVYYDTVDQILQDILTCLLTDLNNDFDRPLPNYEPIVNLVSQFFDDNNIIGQINTFQEKYKTKFDGRLNSGMFNYRMIFELVTIFDRKFEYQVINYYEFFIHVIGDIDKLIWTYNNYQNNIVLDDAFDDIMMVCLEKQYFDSYEFLHEKGFRFVYWNASDLSLINLLTRPDLLYTLNYRIGHLSTNIFIYPYGMIDDNRVMECIVGMIRLFEYSGEFEALNFRLFLDKIDYNANYLHRCNPMPLLLFEENYENIVNSVGGLLSNFSEDILVNYSTDVFFRYSSKTNQVDTWKFNFRTMLRFNSNFLRYVT